MKRFWQTGTGILIAMAIAGAGYAAAAIPAVAALRFSPLVIAIVIGMVVGNAVGDRFPADVNRGIGFCQKRVLRFAIVFFGFRVTFQQIAAVGAPGLGADVLMVISTFVVGMFAGRRLFGLDRDTAILCAAGSSICGAAAVLATEPVLKPDAHKVTVAVGTVVVFGTIAMFLYPVLYPLTGMAPTSFGVYVGSTVHEVAHVVAVGGAVGEGAAEAAVIVKLARVMLLAPFLLALGVALNAGRGTRITIPWFAVLFVAAAGVHSTGVVPVGAVSVIQAVDTFLLASAMAALGLDSRVSRFRGVGFGPVGAALVMFAWLVIGGYLINRLVG